MYALMVVVVVRGEEDRSMEGRESSEASKHRTRGPVLMMRWLDRTLLGVLYGTSQPAVPNGSYLWEISLIDRF